MTSLLKKESIVARLPNGHRTNVWCARCFGVGTRTVDTFVSTTPSSHFAALRPHSNALLDPFNGRGTRSIAMSEIKASDSTGEGSHLSRRRSLQLGAACIVASAFTSQAHAQEIT